MATPGAKPPTLIFDGTPAVPWHKFGPFLIRHLRSHPGCISVAIEAAKDVVPADEPADADGYPLEESHYPNVDHANAAIAARAVSYPINMVKNAVALNEILKHCSEPIQQAVLANTNVAAKAYRFLKNSYGERNSDLETGAVRSMYNLSITATEPLQTYLSRSYELYTLLPQVNGVSNTSIPAFLSIIVHGLAPRPEYNGFRFSFHNSVCPDFASFQTQIIRYQVKPNF